jgi:hypothetical protein
MSSRNAHDRKDLQLKDLPCQTRPNVRWQSFLRLGMSASRANPASRGFNSDSNVPEQMNALQQTLWSGCLKGAASGGCLLQSLYQHKTLTF